VFEATTGAGDRLENVLRQVCGVGVLKAALAGEAVNQRRVNLHELLPGRTVPRVPDADEQAGPGVERRGHATFSLPRYTPRGPNPYRRLSFYCRARREGTLYENTKGRWRLGVRSAKPQAVGMRTPYFGSR